MGRWRRFAFLFQLPEDGNAAVTKIHQQQLREVYAKHGAALVLYARQWCTSPDDALQEALLDLVRQDSTPQDLVAWLFKVVRCKAINLSRAERRRSDHQRRAAENRSMWFDTTVEVGVDGHELASMLAQLPDLEREIVVARIWGELSFEQISELVERPSSTVHRRYREALKQLGQRMTPNDRMWEQGHAR